jgi:hypothetical protein
MSFTLASGSECYPWLNKFRISANVLQPVVYNMAGKEKAGKQ